MSGSSKLQSPAETQRNIQSFEKTLEIKDLLLKILEELQTMNSYLKTIIGES